MAKLFETRDLEQYTQSLADYMPGGKLFQAKNVQDSNFRKLLRGLSGELFNANGYLKEYSEDLNPLATVKFIDEWEAAMGIPDDCFTGTGTLDERRLDILVKLSFSAVQTAEDFEALALLYGITVDVRSGIDVGGFTYTFPFTFFFESTKEARFTMVVEYFFTEPESFTYTFPITFGISTIAFLECLFRKLIPANCNLLFIGA